MTQSSSLQLFDNSVFKFPTVSRSRSGVEFYPSEDLWKYRDGLILIRLDFRIIQAPFEVRQALKRVLTWYAEQQSPNHLDNMFDRFRHFALSVRLTDNTISSVHLINYRTMLHRGIEWYLGSLSGLLKRWHRMCIPGVSDDAAKFLKDIRVKGNRKGVAVQTMDPLQGRFTDIEFEAIRAALTHAYETATIGKDEYVLALLFLALGPRPIQYAAMKVCDVSTWTAIESSTTYLLSIPRAKKREPYARSSFKKRTLIPELGRLVQEYANEVRSRFVGLLDDPGQAPLFPGKKQGANEPVGFEFHRTSQSLADWLERSIDKLQVQSERTGDQINITATRFRRTLGCRAADEGHGELVIAELLDHTDTQNVGVYVEATPGMMARIDRAVAMKLAPLAQAFAGVIITDESQARRAGDSASRISDPRFDPTMKPIGNCGQFGFCGLLAPVACYTCRCFEPWLDGPHERVLDFLMEERERLLSQTDKRIASVNDRTILAVADVVRRCTEIKAGTEEESNG